MPNEEPENDCICAPDKQEVEVPEECVRCPEFPWRTVIYFVNVILSIAIAILCLYHPDDLDAEAEEFKIESDLVGWRPMPDEEGGEAEPEEPKPDYGWRMPDAEPEEAEPEWGLKPDWGWRPFDEEEGG